jgi:hypothetical protein
MNDFYVEKVTNGYLVTRYYGKFVYKTIEEVMHEMMLVLEGKSDSFGGDSYAKITVDYEEPDKEPKIACQEKKERGHKFSPGPWTTEPHGNTTALYSQRTEQQHGLRILNLEEWDSNFDANVNLIEASPDLYEALEEIVIALESLDHYISTEKAEAALAKARGEND